MSLRRRVYLTEATFNFKSDVDRICRESGISKIIEAIRSRDQEKMWSVLGKHPVGTILWRASSKVLRSRIGQQAHKLNPVALRVGIMRDGSYYSPTDKVVQASLHPAAYGLLGQRNYDVDSINSVLGNQRKMFWGEFSEESFKGSINHELAHWADDTLHGRFIAKRLKTARELGDEGIMKGKRSVVGHTSMEMNAQIHAIKTIRETFGKRKFDKITWSTLFTHKPSLFGNFRDFRSDQEYEEIMRKFMSRLNREKLLGKGLKKYPTHSGMKKIWAFFGR